MAYLLIFAICLALCLSSFSLYRYGNIQHQHILVTLSVLTAWCFSFLIVFTIPLDITSTLYRQCVKEQNLNITIGTLNTNNSMKRLGNDNNGNGMERECQAPWEMLPEHIFPSLWRIIYWSSQFLTWMIMPIMQSYLKAGDFTFRGKMKSAIIENAIYYGSYLFICGILLIYLAARGISLDWPKLKAIASSASNTWGLFLIILLLGYALVEVPRSLWNNAKPGFTLEYAYFKAAKLSIEKAETEENVEDVLESLQEISRSVPNNHMLRPCVDTIISKVPAEMQERAFRNFMRSGNNINTTTIVPTQKTLIRIHKQVIKNLQTLQRTEALWNIQVRRILYLEDVTNNMHSSEKYFKSEFPQKRKFLIKWLYSGTIHWYWACVLKTPFLKTLSFLTAIMSAMVVWSELTFFQRRPVLSIFANIINVAKQRYDFFTIEVFSMIILCYLFYCAYSTILRIRFLNLYYLAPYHQTNEHSLIFSGMLLCRLTPPMCLNFLGLIHLDSHIIKERVLETHYTQIMGHMDVIGIISDGFNIYFPMCMLAFCLATWFSLGSRVLNILGFQQFLQNEIIVTELVQEGKNLIAREKRKRQRISSIARRRENLNTDISNFYNNHNNRYRNILIESPKSFINSRPAQNIVSDDLLRHGNNVHYSTLPRTLSDKNNERSVCSTNLKITFKDSNTSNHIGLDDDENDYTNYNEPSRRIFDDL